MDIEKLIARLENDEQFIDAISDAVEALRKQQAVVEAAKDAFLEIRDKEGKVCETYETCEHASCGSSYRSWAIASEFLDALEE